MCVYVIMLIFVCILCYYIYSVKSSWELVFIIIQKPNSNKVFLSYLMNFCTFKNISVIYRVFVKSVEPNNNKSVFKIIDKLMVWIYLSLVTLWQGQCSRKWTVVSVAPHWQNGKFTIFLRNKWWLRELHCIRNLACKICPSRVPI